MEASSALCQKSNKAAGMTQLMMTYWTCAGIGFLYIVGSAFLGHLAANGDSDHSGGDADADHSGGDADADHSGGDADADHSGGDADADHSGGDADADHSGGDADADHSGGDADADHSGGDSDHSGADSDHPGGHGHSSAKSASFRETLSTGVVHPSRTSLGSFLKILGFISPTKLAALLFFFGASGVIIMKLLPWLGVLSLLPALIIGFLLANLMLNAVGSVLAKAHSSTSFKQESLIGSVGRLTFSIEPGTLGEITVLAKGTRYSARARAKNPELTISGSSKVIICDQDQGSGIYLVEPIEEELC